MPLSLRPTLLIVASSLAASVFVVLADSPKPPINSTKGVALRGYDAVAYFTEGKPVRGQAGLRFERVQKRWEQDIPSHIAKGNANWPAVLTK